MKQLKNRKASKKLICENLTKRNFNSYKDLIKSFKQSITFIIVIDISELTFKRGSFIKFYNR
jgi:hypothetical protein